MTSLFRERGNEQPDIDYDEAIIRCAKAGFHIVMKVERRDLHHDTRFLALWARDPGSVLKQQGICDSLLFLFPEAERLLANYRCYPFMLQGFGPFSP